MKTIYKLVASLLLIACATAVAEPFTRTGTAVGTISEVTVATVAKTQVQYWPAGALPEGEPAPFPFTGDWVFTWDEETPGKVTYEGELLFGDFFTLTDAGRMGGISKQIFHGLIHHLRGSADWDAANRQLRVSIAPGARNAGGASTITQTAPPGCEKVKGLFAGMGCSAFREASLELEGLELELQFNEDLSAAEGKVVMVQLSDGAFKSRSDMHAVLKLSLEGP